MVIMHCVLLTLVLINCGHISYRTASGIIRGERIGGCGLVNYNY